MAPPRPVRGLSCEDSFREAAGKVIGTRHEEMMSFAQAALEGRDIEGVHDMRVASRRLRAALELFGEVFPRKDLRPMLRQVKQLADALGEVRDRDVLLARLEAERKTHPPSQRLALDGLEADLRTQRDIARQDLKITLERLEREDFGRHFIAFVARETA
jgi:CHAD domain-containing protein